MGSSHVVPVQGLNTPFRNRISLNKERTYRAYYEATEETPVSMPARLAGWGSREFFECGTTHVIKAKSLESSGSAPVRSSSAQGSRSSIS